MRRNYMKDVIFVVLVILISLIDFEKINLKDFDWKFSIAIFIILMIVMTISFVFSYQLFENNPGIYEKKIQLFYLLKENDEKVVTIKDKLYEKYVSNIKNELVLIYLGIFKSKPCDTDDVIEAIDYALLEGNFDDNDKKKYKKILKSMRKTCYSYRKEINKLFGMYESKELLHMKSFLVSFFGILLSVISLVYAFVFNNISNLFNQPIIIILIIFILLFVCLDIVDFYNKKRLRIDYYNRLIESINEIVLS